MGSEMCIRDRHQGVAQLALLVQLRIGLGDDVLAFLDRRQVFDVVGDRTVLHPAVCLLYTSDAADERSSVDLGGRRIIKKKT